MCIYNKKTQVNFQTPTIAVYSRTQLLLIYSYDVAHDLKFLGQDRV
jgi:hypothetical protein